MVDCQTWIEKSIVEAVRGVLAKIHPKRRMSLCLSEPSGSRIKITYQPGGPETLDNPMWTPRT